MGRTENAPDRRARLKNETSGLDSKIKVKKTAVLRSLGLWSRAFLRRRRSESGEELVETLIQKGDVIVDGGEEGNRSCMVLLDQLLCLLVELLLRLNELLVDRGRTVVMLL